MLHKTILFVCDGKGCSVGLGAIVEFASIDQARLAGWAVSRDRKHCYCPRCANKYRNVGMSYHGYRSWA